MAYYLVSLPLITTKVNIMSTTNLLVDRITEGIQDKKGYDIVIVDLTGIEDAICHYFVICQGNSPSHIQAITDSVSEVARTKAQARPTAIDGLRNAQWVAMDYTDVIVHIFLPEARCFYDLEHLWADAKLTRIPNID